MNIDQTRSSLFQTLLWKKNSRTLWRLTERKSRHDLAEILRDYLKRTYPTQYWLVTVYDDVNGDDKHYVTGVRIVRKYRYEGVNYVVTRYPKHAARKPKLSISEVVGNEDGDNAKDVLNSIKSKFDKSHLSYASIHVVKKIKSKSGWWLKEKHHKTTLSTATFIPKEDYFWKEFSGVFVIVVAPR